MNMRKYILKELNYLALNTIRTFHLTEFDGSLLRTVVEDLLVDIFMGIYQTEPDPLQLDDFNAITDWCHNRAHEICTWYKDKEV